MVQYIWPFEWRNRIATDTEHVKEGDLIPLWPDDNASGACDNCGGSEGEPGFMMAFEIKQPGQHVAQKYFGPRKLYGSLTSLPCPVCAGNAREKFLADNSGLSGRQLGNVDALSVRLDDVRQLMGNERAREYTGAALGDMTDKKHIRSLLFTGPYGVGKTMLLAALVNGARLVGIRSRYTTAEGMLQEIRATFDRESRTRITEDVIAEYSRLPVLAIDELDRANFDSRWVSTQYFEIVNRRLMSNVFTAFASNLEVGEMFNYGDPLAAIASRLQAGLIAPIDGRDLRPMIGARLQQEQAA